MPFYDTGPLVCQTAAVDRPRSATICFAASRDSRSASSTSAIERGVRHETRPSVSSTTSAMAGKEIRPSRNASTAISSAAFSVQVAEPPIRWAS